MKLLQLTHLVEFVGDRVTPVHKTAEEERQTDPEDVPTDLAPSLVLLGRGNILAILYHMLANDTNDSGNTFNNENL